MSGTTLRNTHWWIGGRPLEPERSYQVAGTDWELEPYGGYVDPVWKLQPVYDTTVIVREAVEAYLAAESTKNPGVETGSRATELWRHLE